MPAIIEGLNNEGLMGCEACRLPGFIVRLEEDHSEVFFYGIDNVPTTMLHVRTCIRATESNLLRVLDELDKNYHKSRSVLDQRLTELRTDTNYRLTVVERYEALLKAFPEYCYRPRLRSPARVRHADIDPYGVPYTRDLLPQWFAEVVKK